MILLSARCQTMYWHQRELRIVNFRTRTTFSANPVVLELIRFYFEPATVEAALVKFSDCTPESVGESILGLIEAGLLIESGSEEDAADAHIHSAWRDWLPEGSYHFLSKDAPYAARGELAPEETQQLLSTPAPSNFKREVGAERLSLERRAWDSDSYMETLRARRTRREFSRLAVPLEQVAHLLDVTWGVQDYLESSDFGLLPLKTSPSGGARHPIEVYVLSLRIEGLAPGIYHYGAQDHSLVRLSDQASPEQARAWCADQPYASDAAALFIMTAVFARTMWKYRHPRAYRVVLLDAGHLGQTFCLTATRLGLAPFSTAALADTRIEKDLGIDGVSESVLYVTGCGLPPESTTG